MFLPELLLWLSKSGWLMLLHLSARSSFPKPLSPDEEAALLARLQGGDREAANALIEHNLRLVAHIARKYAQPGVDQDDLVSVGSLGLVKAVHTFRPEAGRLTSYASRCIENEILMFFRANRKNRNVVLVGETVGQDSEGNDLQLADLLGTICSWPTCWALTPTWCPTPWRPPSSHVGPCGSWTVCWSPGNGRCCACAMASRTACPGPSIASPQGWESRGATYHGLRSGGWKS